MYKTVDPVLDQQLRRAKGRAVEYRWNEMEQEKVGRDRRAHLRCNRGEVRSLTCSLRKHSRE